MSTIGSYYGDMVEIGTLKVPDKYLGNSKRAYRPGPQGREPNY